MMLSFVLVVEFDYALLPVCTYTTLGEVFGPQVESFVYPISSVYACSSGGVKLQNFPLTDRSSSY